MSAYIACISDTLIRLIEDAIECEGDATRIEDQSGHAYNLGRAEALAQALHTWKNQLETFGLIEELGPVGQNLVKFCLDRGLP